MTELLVAPEKDIIKTKGCNKTAYDMTMGTSQMLACLEEKLKLINEVLDGKSSQKVARNNDISRGKLRVWIIKYNKYGESSLENKKRI